MDVILSDKMDQALLKAAVALLKRCEGRLVRLSDLEQQLHLLKMELPGVCVCARARACDRGAVCVVCAQQGGVLACGVR
jgi:hypothetical protein